MNDLVQIDRKELYELVWSKPVTQIAREFGVSDVAVAKICKKMGIPKPGLGYWAKKQYGKRVRQKPLPKLKPGERESYTIHGTADANKKPESALILEKKEFESKTANRITVSKVLRNPHPLVSQTRDRHQAYKKRDYHGYHQLPAGLDFSVSNESFPRALRIMDALVKAIEKRDYSVTVRSGYGSYTSVEVNGEEITFDIFESSKRIPNPEHKTDRYANQFIFIPTGRLSLRTKNFYQGQKVISDGKVRKLEDRLNEFIVLLVKISEKEKIRRKNREKREQESRERAEKEREIARLKELEQRRVHLLFENAQAWNKCELARQYMLVVKERTPEKSKEWMQWAENYLDGVEKSLLNPILEKPSDMGWT